MYHESVAIIIQIVFCSEVIFYGIASFKILLTTLNN